MDVCDPASPTKATTGLEKQTKAAPKRMELEEAAELRDRVRKLRAAQIDTS